MQDQGDPSDDPLWVNGDMMFRVAGTAAEPDRLLKVRRPFALVGRSSDADIPLDDRAVSARHTYLHLDHRGVYAVDLVTRTGTRINGTGQMVGWLRPGDWIEISGRRVELVRMRIDDAVIDPPHCAEDMLSDNEQVPLVSVTLEPRRSADPPWVLGSELVFLGWSASCGIQIKDSSVARTHCALVRSPRGAYLVDLCGRQTWVEEKVVRGAAALHDGDILTIGSTQFTVRVEPPAASRNATPFPRVIPRDETLRELATIETAQPHALMPFHAPAFPAIHPDLIPSEAQAALMAWMVGTIQGGQGEMLRRQGEFQAAMTQVLQRIQQDNAALLEAQLERIESIDRELAAIRAEIERRNTPRTPPPPPNVAPLRIARPAQTSEPGSPESKASTSWLLQRVGQLEEENRSAWKDLLGRLSQSRRAT